MDVIIVNEDTTIRCAETSSFKDQLNYERYYPCPHKVVYRVTFKSSMTSKIVEKTLCKRHYNALVKNCARVKKLSNFDSHIKIIEEIK